MADVRIARKSFLKGLGLAAAASVVRPASAVAASVSGQQRLDGSKAVALDLPRKVRAAARTVATRTPGA